MTSRFMLLTSCLLLASSACIINTTDDDDDDTGASTSGGGGSETEAAETGSADGTGAGSSGDVVSTSGGPEIDCSLCDADNDPDPLCHSSFDAASGQCVCDPGYVFEGDDGFQCVREDPMPGTGGCGDDPNVTTDAAGNCVCDAGYEWCSNDPEDLTCCEA